jgi:hypothetical protein
MGCVTSATTNSHVKSRSRPKLRQPSLGVDGSTVSSTEVVVGPFLASRNKPPGIHAEIGNRVDQELPFTRSVRNEEAACRCRADICRRWCLLRWFPLLAVCAWRGTLLRSGSEAAMIPAEGGCDVVLGRGTAVRAAVPVAGAGISGAGARVLGAEGKVPEAGAESVLLGAECCHLAGEVLSFLQKCGVVGGWTNASERQLGCGLGDAVRTAGCGVQFTLMLTGETGRNIGE